jgi:hypothetical protein
MHANLSLRAPLRPAVVVVSVAVALVVAGQPALAVADGPSTVAGVSGTCDQSGSSNPTFYANNHRMLVVPGSGRVLAVFDPHGSGQKLAWRDSNSTSWQSKTLFDGSGADETLNDRTASIALDGNGDAWVAWAGYSFSLVSPVKMRRLTNLDAPEGPDLGPVVTVEPAGMGSVTVDLQFHGGVGFLVWNQRTGAFAYELRAATFAPTSATPDIQNRGTLYRSSNGSSSGTLVPTAAGMRVVARTGKLQVYSHVGGTQWSAGSSSVSMPSKSKPSAVSFGDEILVAFQSAPYNNDMVKVVRFSSTGGNATTSLSTSSGYMHPALAANGTNAWVVMVKIGATGRSVVSRRLAGPNWEGEVTELSPSVADGGDYAWPNTVREVDGRLRFLVDGKRCPTSAKRNAVLAYQRAV